MANMVMFIILAVVILGSAVMCVTTKRIMRAATFMLFIYSIPHSTSGSEYDYSKKGVVTGGLNGITMDLLADK